MTKIALGLSACLAVAVITMGQVPVSITPGAPSMLNAFTPIGGATSGSPGLRANGAVLEARLGDNSAYASFTALNLSYTSGIFVGGTMLLTSATAPTISSGFGTSPAIVTPNGSATFRVNVGTGGAATTGVVGLPTATNGWNCQVTDLTNNTVTRETASTTTTVTVTAAAAWAASDILIFNCAAF